MALERKRALSALTAHWAVVDLKDEAGATIMPAGTLKPPKLEYATWIEEDGRMLEDSLTREIAVVEDVQKDSTLQQLIPQSLALAQFRILELEGQQVVLEEEKAVLQAQCEALTAQIEALSAPADEPTGEWSEPE